MRIYLLRHGETEGNALSKYIGTTDEEVSKIGMQVLLKRRKISVDYAFCSPRKRCLQTAEIMVNSKLGMDICEDLKECNFGDFENKNFKELAGNLDYQKWLLGDCKGEIPNGESMETFSKRTVSAFISCVAKAKVYGYESICIICHGGSIMAILQYFKGGDFYDYKVGNGECVRIMMNEDE